MSLFLFGNPLSGDSVDNFIFNVDGNGSPNTISGGDGDDYLLGGITELWSSGNAGSAPGTGSDLTLYSPAWSLDDNPDIANATTVPHTTVYNSAASATTAWYRVTASAGQTITLDLDYGVHAIGIGVEAELALWDPTGAFTLAVNEGSSSVPDPALTYTFTSTGTFLIQVGVFSLGPGMQNFVGGEEYLLHVSLTGQAATGAEAGSGDTLDGGIGNDVLYGMGGGDTLHGGADNDLLDGGAGNDSLSGGTGIDAIHGGSGNDIISVHLADGGAGETYDGGYDGGNDSDTLFLWNTAGNSYVHDLRDDTLISIETIEIEDPGDGNTGTAQINASQIGTGFSSTGTLLFSGFSDVIDRFEVTMDSVTTLNLSGLNILDADAVSDRIVVIGDGDGETITGTSIRDLIYGNGGADTIDGRAGADEMFGGDGNDLYYVDDAGDVVTETTVNIAIGGTDRVISSITYTLPVNVENLTMVGTGNIIGNGNGSNNFMSGNA